MKQSLQLNIRLTDDVRRTLDEIESETGLTDQAIAKALFHALCAHWKAYSKLVIPLKLADPDDGKQGKRRAA